MSRWRRSSTLPEGLLRILDVSVDYTTKGIYDTAAYPWSYATGVPGSGYVHGGQKAGPTGTSAGLGHVEQRLEHRLPRFA